MWFVQLRMEEWGWQIFQFEFFTLYGKEICFLNLYMVPSCYIESQSHRQTYEKDFFLKLWKWGNAWTLASVYFELYKPCVSEICLIKDSISSTNSQKVCLATSNNPLSPLLIAIHLEQIRMWNLNKTTSVKDSAKFTFATSSLQNL